MGSGQFWNDVWAIYHFGFIAGDAEKQLLAALPPVTWPTRWENRRIKRSLLDSSCARSTTAFLNA
jgi:hypothetical protein